MGAGLELYGQRRDGTEFPVDISLSALRTDDDLVLLSAAVRDITERRRTEEARLRLAAIVESSDDAIIAKTLDGVITSWNGGAERIYGYRADEVVGRHIGILFPPDRGDEVPQMLEAAARGERLDHHHTVRTRSDGTRIDVSVTVSPIWDSTGRVAGASTIARDITPLTRAQETLRKSEERFRGLLEAAPDAMVGVDDEGRIVLVNGQAETLFGYHRTELLGQTVEVLVPEAVRPLHPGHRARYFAAPVTRRMGIGLELTARRRDGSEFPAEISLSALQGEDGLIITAAVRDVTERKRIEAEREQLRVRQSERLETLGQLAGGIAHDFNNLLTLILSYGRFVARRVEGDPDLSNDVGEILAAAERAAALTRQLLIFGRREVTRLEILDVNELLGSTETMLRRTLGEQVDLQVTLAPDLPPVMADRSQLEQVIVNLAVNARDAMPGGGLLHLRTERLSRPSGPALRLTVSDTGCGMPPEVRSRIFEPFFTTKPKGEGTGLGLSTVYAIVTQAGGRIDVYSEEGRGAAFKITLPGLEATEQRPAPGPAADEETLRGDGHTVLVAEDEPAVRAMTARILTEAGYSVVVADSAHEALELCRSDAVVPDVLVTDVVMPGLSGRELADAVSAHIPGIPVVFTSGYSHDVIARQGVLDPDTLLVEKPFTETALLRSVGAALHRRSGDA